MKPKFNPLNGTSLIAEMPLETFRGEITMLWRWDPYTGESRLLSDIQSDPQGRCILPPKECFGSYPATSRMLQTKFGCETCHLRSECIPKVAQSALDTQVGGGHCAPKVAQSALDTQVGGGHYKKYGNYQPWQVLAKWLTPEELKGAMKKEVITYLCREADKGGCEDIKKAMHTLQIYLELTENE